MKKLILSMLVAMGLIGAVYGAAATLPVNTATSIGAGGQDVGSILDIAKGAMSGDPQQQFARLEESARMNY